MKKAPVDMSNPCECCKSKVKFIRQMHGNFKDSMPWFHHCCLLLVIPERLVSHFRGNISGAIKLEAPNGQVYDVGVAEKMNRTVLQSRWEAFVDANQIQENYSLMFRYLGISHFKVTIFDSNGERVSCCAGTMKIPCHVEKPSTYCADMSSSQSSDSDRCCRKPAKTPSVKSSSDEFSAGDSPSECESMESDDLQMLSKGYVLSGRCHLTEEQEEEIDKFVATIRPEIPVLVVMMKKTNVKHYPDLVISKDYAVAYFPHKTQFVTLKLPEKSKGWPCKFCIRPHGSGHNLYLGEFVRDNSIREGDLCLFQPMTVVEATRFTVMVHLLRKAGRTDIGPNHGEDSPSEYGSTRSDQQKTSSKVQYILSSRCLLDEEDEVGIDALIAKIQPEIPLLAVQMKKSNVNGRQASLVISKDYAIAHFPSESQNITLRLRGGKEKWSPHLHIRSDGGGYVLNGRWSEFVRDNRLQEEDICLLQPITKGKRRRFMVMVHLLPKARSTTKSKGRNVVPGSNNGGKCIEVTRPSRVKDESNDDDSQGSGYVLLGSSTRLTLAQEKIIAEKVKVIQSQAPIYVATIDKSNSFALDLGTTPYAAQHLPDGKQTLTLRQAGWSKAWRVEMHNRRMLPRGGWREFAGDNRLQAGDLCLLEPVKNERLAMAVHIIRSEQYY